MNNSNNQLVELFEVEELEERMEFAKWTASAGYNESEGAHGEVGVEIEF